MPDSWPQQCQKVILVVGRYPGRGGVETVVGNLVSTFREAGLQVEVITLLPGLENDDTTSVIFKPDWLHGQPLLRGRGHNKSKQAILMPLLVYKRYDRWRSLRQFRRKIEACSDDTMVILTSSLTAATLIETGYRPGVGGPLLVGQHHGSFQSIAENPATRAAIATAFRDIDAFAALSDADARGFSELFAVPTFGIPNPIRAVADRRDLSEPTEAEKPYFAVALARYSPEKRLDKMIRLFLSATKTEDLERWELHLYGDGPEREKLAARIESYGTNRVKLKGWTEHSAEVLGEARLNLLTSVSEGFPMSVLEAAQSAVPTMAFDCSPGLHQSVLETHGYLVPQDDDSLYIATLRTLLRDPDKLVATGLRAAAAASRYAPPAVFERWAAVAREIYYQRSLSDNSELV